MSNLAKIAIGGTFIFLYLLIAVFFFLRSQVVKSFPVTAGTISLQGLHKSVQVVRDNFGVPHISARDEHDLMFTLGYVHAQDRLWQMELGRRAGEGRLSEIFKEPTLKFDILFRTLGFARLVDTIACYLHPNSRRMLQDYAEGVNVFIATHKGKYPIEFDMLNFEPEPWTPRHSLLIGRLMAWELNFAWWDDLTYDEIAAKVSQDKFREITLDYPSDVPSIIQTQKAKQSLSGIKAFMDDVRNYREYFNLGSFSSGSNAWVISSSKSLSGKPILANDPHLKTSVPSKWYEAHLTAPGWNVAGVTLPGAPGVIIGHNEHVAPQGLAGAGSGTRVAMVNPVCRTRETTREAGERCGVLMEAKPWRTTTLS